MVIIVSHIAFSNFYKLAGYSFPSTLGYSMTKFLSAILRLRAKITILMAKTTPIRQSGESLKRHLIAYR